MKRITMMLCMLPLLLMGCGHTQKDVEVIGQVKRVTHVTPLLWPDYKYADISMGVLRNGVGSMSTEDVWVVVQDKQDEQKLKTAAENGKLVKITYDSVRVPLLYPPKRLTSVEVID